MIKFLVCAVFLAACSTGSQPAATQCGATDPKVVTVTNTEPITNVVTHTVTETITITETIEVPTEAEWVPATLRVDFAYPSANRGAWEFTSGAGHTNMGAITLTASESMTVESIVIQTWVNDTLAAYGPEARYTQASDGDVIFADHWQNCVLSDYNTGVVFDTAQVVDGQLLFEGSITVDESAYALMSLFCDHTGIESGGQNAGFAIDLSTDGVAIGFTSAGDQAETTVGDWNGMEMPTKSLILIN